MDGQRGQGAVDGHGGGRGPCPAPGGDGRGANGGERQVAVLLCLGGLWRCWWRHDFGCCLLGVVVLNGKGRKEEDVSCLVEGFACVSSGRGGLGRLRVGGERKAGRAAGAHFASWGAKAWAGWWCGLCACGPGHGEQTRAFCHIFVSCCPDLLPLPAPRVGPRPFKQRAVWGLCGPRGMATVHPQHPCARRRGRTCRNRTPTPLPCRVCPCGPGHLPSSSAFCLLLWLPTAPPRTGQP